MALFFIFLRANKILDVSDSTNLSIEEGLLCDFHRSKVVCLYFYILMKLYTPLINHYDFPIVSKKSLPENFYSFRFYT